MWTPVQSHSSDRTHLRRARGDASIVAFGDADATTPHNDHRQITVRLDLGQLDGLDVRAEALVCLPHTAVPGVDTDTRADAIADELVRRLRIVPCTCQARPR